MSAPARDGTILGAGPAWLSPDEAARVRLSFEALAGRSDEIACVFYDRLFELDPSLRQYFPADMAAQREKLMLTLARTVAYLDRFEAIAHEVDALGRRHRLYGTRELDYATVGDALLFALGQASGSAWTRAVEDAWERTFTTLSQAMLRASERGEE